MQVVRQVITIIIIITSINNNTIINSSTMSSNSMVNKVSQAVLMGHIVNNNTLKVMQELPEIVELTFSINSRLQVSNINLCMAICSTVATAITETTEMEIITRATLSPATEVDSRVDR